MDLSHLVIRGGQKPFLQHASIPGTLNGRFDVAPPGKPEAFAPYLSWTARKLK